MPSLLIVDDEPEIRGTTKWAFEMAGFDVHAAASGEEALHQVKLLRPNVLLIDYKLPRMSGLELLKAVKQEDPQAVAFLITGLTHESDELEEESRRLGAVGFLHKPLQLEQVLKLVKERMGGR